MKFQCQDQDLYPDKWPENIVEGKYENVRIAFNPRELLLLFVDVALNYFETFRFMNVCKKMPSSQN